MEDQEIPELQVAKKPHIESDTKMCLICRDEDNSIDFVTRCNHHFHQICLESWHYKNKTCPNCRTEITLNQMTEDIRNKFRFRKLIKNLNSDAKKKEFVSKLFKERIDEKSLLEIIPQLKDVMNQRNEDGMTLLMYATENGSVAAVKLLLEMGAAKDDKDNKGSEAFHYSFRHKNVELVKLLVTGETRHIKSILYYMGKIWNCASLIDVIIPLLEDVNIRYEQSNTILTLASSIGHIDAVRQLISKGADLKYLNEYKRSVFSLAVKNNYFDVVQALMTKLKIDESDIFEAVEEHRNKEAVLDVIIPLMEDVNSKNIRGVTMLMFVSKFGLKGPVNKLIQQGARVNEENSEFYSALIFASQEGHLDIVQVLIDNGARVNDNRIEEFNNNYYYYYEYSSCHYRMIALHFGKYCDKFTEMHYIKNGTALMVAAYLGHLEIVKLLLNRGADVNLKDKNGKTSLMCAVHNNHIEIIKEFLSNGAKVNDHNNEGQTALMYAASKNYVEVMSLLIDHGASINKIDCNYEHALFKACAYNHGQAACLLVKFGAQVNRRMPNRKTVLMEACIKENLEIVEISIEKGANVNAANIVGITPLMYAAESGNLYLVFLLLYNGAKVNHKTDDGSTALHFGAFNPCVAKVLLKYGADINMRNKFGQTPLSCAASKGSLEGVIFLLDNGADVNGNENDNNCPLFFAIKFNRKEIVQLLLDRGAALDGGIQGFCALFTARKSGNYDCERVIEKHKEKLEKSKQKTRD